jgi:serine phosphatase RsbU (regulator of sigma subunit)
MCTLDIESHKLQFAGANNPLYIIKKTSELNVSEFSNYQLLEHNDYTLIEVKSDKMPIGVYHGEQKPFTNYSFQLSSPSSIYLFTDGYADQFGGDSGKKFKYLNFKKHLMEIQDMSADDQKCNLNDTIEKWRGPIDQIDDILVIGMKI